MREPRRARLAALLLSALMALPHPGSAQEARPARIEETVTPPRGAGALQVREIAEAQGISSEMIYAERMSGDLAAGRTEVLKPERSQPDMPTLPEPGPVSTGMVVLLLLALLLVWLRYGGAGMLLTRNPEAERKPTVAPDGWNISAEDQDGDPQTLLAQIAAMPDRSAALVRLLRHCLLTAADETDTRLMRADTERTAYRRLPGSWREAQALAEILRRAELAHYGGQPVAEDRFSATLGLGRAILLSARGRLA